jgi:thioredoxin reductase
MVVSKKLIIVGAGPIGLEAALAAEKFAVTVLEKGDVGDSLRRWGDTRLFSPMRMNLSARARRLVSVGEEELLTGPELIERALLPIARNLDVKTRHRVISIGRARMRRDEFANHPIRGERNFRLLVETPEGEKFFEADAVIDASGVFDQPQWMGAGGVPARGERRLGDRVIRHIGGVKDLRDRRVLLVGHGHSAAHAVDLLVTMGARVTWAVRSSNARPVAEVANDPLPERARVAARANDLAGSPSLRMERRAHVEAVDDQLNVELSGGRSVSADAIVSLTGYRPDLSILGELAVEISPSTEGASRLHRAISNITDCLSVPCIAPKDLDSGEPNFALAGAKSYGRSRTFLLQTGISQLEALLQQFS